MSDKNKQRKAEAAAMKVKGEMADHFLTLKQVILELSIK